MKIFLGILVIIFSTFIGYILSKKYTKLKNFYCNFDNFNKMLKTEIAFSQKTLKEIIAEKYSINNDFLYNFKLYLENKENFCLNINYLSSDEKAFLLEYFENIGKTEKGSQLEFLKKAEALDTGYCFPSRIDDIAVLFFATVKKSSYMSLSVFTSSSAVGSSNIRIGESL